jgi:hypothetical protein
MKNYIIIGVLIALLIGCGCLYNLERKERIRFENNYETASLQLNRAEILKANEVEIYAYKLDSLRKELSIRKSDVIAIFKTKYNFKDSIILVPIDTIRTVYDTIPLPDYYEYKSPCYDLQISNENDKLTIIPNFHDNFTGYLYKERKYKFWFIRWGAISYKLKIQSECKNSLIDIEKLIVIQ